jgi:hypothetical protein
MSTIPSPAYLAMIREQIQLRLDMDATEAWEMLLWDSVLVGDGGTFTAVLLVPPHEGLYDVTALQRLIVLAQGGDSAADKVLCAVASHCLNYRQLPPGTPLQGYIVNRLQSVAMGQPWPPTKSGPKERRNIQRDVIVALIVAKIARDLDVKPTRSSTSTCLCACSIIEEATKDTPEPLTEAAAAKIWSRYNRFAFVTAPVVGMN